MCSEKPHGVWVRGEAEVLEGETRPAVSPWWRQFGREQRPGPGCLAEIQPSLQESLICFDMTYKVMIAIRNYSEVSLTVE